MTKKIRVFLVRHGQSEANLDWAVNQRVADHAIKLTEDGLKQAVEAGKFLAGYFKEQFASDKWGDPLIPSIRLWNSPYQRTRQTSDEILRNCLLSRKVKIHDRDGLTYDLRNPGDSWFFDKERVEKSALHELPMALFKRTTSPQYSRYCRLRKTRD